MRSSPDVPDPLAGRAASILSRGLDAARIVTAVAAVGLPLFHAALFSAAGRPAWPMLVAVAAGVVTRATAGAASAVATAFVLAPVWQGLVSLLGVPADFDQIAPWLAFLGAALAWPEPRGWQSRGPWRVPIAAWALVISLVAPIVTARELDFSWNAAFWPHLGGVALLGANAQLVALLLFDWYHGASEPQRRLAWFALVPGTAAAAFVALWQQHVDPAFLSSPLWTGLRRSAGTFFDANATAAWLALTSPVLASSWLRPAAVPAAPWRLVCLGLALAAIMATGSRSALAALVVIVAVAIASAGSAWRWGAVAAALGLAVWGLITTKPVVDPHSGPALGRLAYTLQRTLSSGPDGVWMAVWDRGGYGPVAMAMIADHPWTGIGPGLFGTLVPGYAVEALGQPLPPDNAQNWWRHHIAELGLPGALPGLVCSLLALWALVRRRGVATAPLAGVGLLALMSPPTPHPLLQVLVGLVIAHAVTSWPPPAGAPVGARTGGLIWVLALACAVGSAVTGWRDLRPAYRAVRFHTPYSYGVTPVGPTPYGPGRWMDQRGVAVVDPGSHHTLVARIVVPHDDAATRPVRIVVSGRGGIACVHEATDTTPTDCRLTVPPGEWPMVRVDISRPWPGSGGTRRAAVVNAWLDD